MWFWLLSAAGVFYYVTWFVLGAGPRGGEAIFALMLFGGLLRGKALLKYLLQAAYDGLTEEGWRKLSRNWGFFFISMAVANEVMRRSMSFDAWLAVKVWGVTVVSLLFALANIPMLMRHGLTIGNAVDSEEIGETTPPQG